MTSSAPGLTSGMSTPHGGFMHMGGGSVGSGGGTTGGRSMGSAQAGPRHPGKQKH